MTDWSIVGHDLAVQQMRVAVKNDDVPHALLITGPDSVGKMTLGSTVARALLCKAAADARPCGSCLACRKFASANHPDFHLVAPEEVGGRLKIEQIRDAERFLSLTPHESTYKVVLIDAFDRATISAANALLKTLEEPPSYAHLILLATTADVLLPTIVSRSQQLPLRPLSPGTIHEALVSRWDVSADLAERLARISGGRIGWAIRAATDPEVVQHMEQALSGLFTLLSQDLPSRFEQAKTLAKDTPALLETLAYWRVVWRDVLLLQTDNAEGITCREHSDILARICEQVTLDKTLELLKALGDSETALQRNANTQLVLENLMLSLPTFTGALPEVV